MDSHLSDHMPDDGNFKRRYGMGAVAFTVILFIWEIFARFSGLSSYLLPDPVTVVCSLYELLINGTLVRHTVASLYRVTAGFYLAIICGIPLGILLGRFQYARWLINPIIQFLRPISPLAWIPLAMLWFGIGDQPAIFLIFLSSFFPLVVSTTIAVHNINPTYLQVAANFKFNRIETLTKVIFPAIMPEIITALRLTITIAWLVVVAAEMIAVQSGLGYLIWDARNALRMDYVMDGMIIIGIIGLFLDGLMKRLGQVESAQWGNSAR